MPMQKELCVPLTAELAAQTAAFLDSCLDGMVPPPAAKIAGRLHIAVDEVSSNLLSYSDASQVTCRFAADNGKIILTFLDDGIPYDPLLQAAPDTTAPAEERTPGGLGLLLVRRLMDDVQYQYNDAKNILTLCIQLS